MKRLAGILLFSLVWNASSRAADPEVLTDLREKYLEALEGIRGPIKDKYLNQMQEMLTEYTREGKLQEALAVREAIRSMEDASSDTPKPSDGQPSDGGEKIDPDDPPSKGTVVLRPEDATLEGALKLYRGYIVYWIRPNCRARWHSRDVPAGKYDIYFVYSAGYGQGGTVEVRDFTYSFEVKIARTEFGQLDRVKVGTIETRGGIGMHITSLTNSKEGVMSLKEIQLVPAK